MKPYQQTILTSYTHFKSTLKCRLLGMVEIGSYAREEAVSTSDRDIRLIVENDEPFVLLQEHAWTDMPAAQISYLDWADLNQVDEASYQMDEVSFGITNLAFIEHCLQTTDRYPLNDHTCLYQGQILFDEEGLIQRFRDRYAGEGFANIVSDYLRQTEWRVTRRLPKEGDYVTQHLDRRKKVIPVVHTCCRIARDVANIDAYQKRATYIVDFATLEAYYQREWPWFYPTFAALFALKRDEARRRGMFECIEREDTTCLRHLQQLRNDTETLWQHFATRFTK